MKPSSQKAVSALLEEAKAAKGKPAKKNPLEIAIPLAPVAGVLWSKGYTQKEMLTWFRRRGHDLKKHHIKIAVREFRKSES